MKLTQVGLMVLLAFASGAQAAKPVFMETYDLATPTHCDGMTLDGVTYSFTIAGSPSDDCMAGTGSGPGHTNNIDPLNVEGNSAGVLHLTFSVPTTRFSFGVAESTTLDNHQNSVVVNLYRPGAGLLRETVSLTTTNDPLFVGGAYTYEGPAITTATIQFSGPFSRFALDNMSYFRPGSLVK